MFGIFTGVQVFLHLTVLAVSAVVERIPGPYRIAIRTVWCRCIPKRFREVMCHYQRYPRLARAYNAAIIVVVCSVVGTAAGGVVYHSVHDSRSSVHLASQYAAAYHGLSSDVQPMVYDLGRVGGMSTDIGQAMCVDITQVRQLACVR